MTDGGDEFTSYNLLLFFLLCFPNNLFCKKNHEKINVQSEIDT